MHEGYFHVHGKVYVSNPPPCYWHMQLASFSTLIQFNFFFSKINWLNKNLIQQININILFKFLDPKM